MTPWQLLCVCSRTGASYWHKRRRFRLRALCRALRGQAGGGDDHAGDAGQHHLCRSERGNGVAARGINQRPYVDDVASGVEGLPRSGLDHPVLLAGAGGTGNLPIPVDTSDWLYKLPAGNGQLDSGCTTFLLICYKGIFTLPTSS